MTWRAASISPWCWAETVAHQVQQIQCQDAHPDAELRALCGIGGGW